MKRILFLIILFIFLSLSDPAFGDEMFEVIRQGSKGESVVRVQERLADLGYYTYKPTGSYQTVTRNAVLAYQDSAGLKRDGTIGEESYYALFSRTAVRSPFHAAVPLTYTAQSQSIRRGTAQVWEIVKEHLTPESSYKIINVATGESVSLIYKGGENHAEFVIPKRQNAYDPDITGKLQSWLGKTDSYYKCAVLLQVKDQQIASSIQWRGNHAICLYTTGSRSHVYGLPDPDHEAMILRAVNGR